MKDKISLKLFEYIKNNNLDKISERRISEDVDIVRYLTISENMNKLQIFPNKLTLGNKIYERFQELL